MSIGVLALIVSIFVFLLLVRNPNLNHRTALAWPDAPAGRRFTRYFSFPTTLDDQGTLAPPFRALDWWDRE